MNSTAKGAHTPLNVTPEARHRVFVGLGWDPSEQAGLMDKAKAWASGRKAWHDLDLSCYLYDEAKNFIDVITAKDGKHIDRTGQIYHSGDNVEGIGDGDDEQISVELKDLNPDIHHIVFTASIRSGHTFQALNAPEIRLADGYSGHEFLRLSLAGRDSRDKSGFIFVHLYRTAQAESGWMVHNISEFLSAEHMQQWPVLMTLHLKTPEAETQAAS